MSGCVPRFLVFLLLHDFIAFIDPAIDRRIIYNDFRSNPYLHFGAGLVPRALGVQLGKFHLLFVHLLLFTHHVLFMLHCIILLLVIRIYIIDIDCDHPLGYRDRHL